MLQIKTMRKLAFLATGILSLFFVNQVQAQPDRWQQHIKYNINVNMNVLTNQFTGTEKLSTSIILLILCRKYLFTCIGMHFNQEAVWM